MDKPIKSKGNVLCGCNFIGKDLLSENKFVISPCRKT